jgi:predicted aldo/keto reductase-like oxidoreductase
LLYKQLGKTRFQVAVMGVGGIPIQRVGAEVAKEVVAAALELGSNFLDSARGYTDSEGKFGQALLGVRDRFILASKSTARDAIAMRKDVETSLRNFQTDHIDLYQLHNVSAEGDLQKVLAPGGAVEALLQAKQQGLIGEIGISSHSAEVLQLAVESGVFATVQVPINAVERQFIPVLEKAKQLGMGTIAMKPLAGGSFRHPELALRQLLAEPLVDVLIPGVDSVEQMRQNAGLANDYQPLSAEEAAILAAEVDELGKGFCRRCEYCLPCPEDIKIPQVFILEGYVTRYNLAEWAQGRYAGMSSNAENCAECGLCESRCPYQLPIRDMLKRAHANLKP